MDNYITPKELREIAEFCELLDAVWNRLTNVNKSVSFEAPEGIEHLVHDSNGDLLGTINWADCGAAFYPATPNE